MFCSHHWFGSRFLKTATFTAWAQWTEKSIHLPPRKGNKIGNPPTTKMEGLKWIDHHLFKPGTEPETHAILNQHNFEPTFFFKSRQKKETARFWVLEDVFCSFTSWKTCGVYQWFSGYVLFRSPHQHQQISPLGGGNSKIFYVHPLPGEMIQFDEPIFQTGGQTTTNSFRRYFFLMPGTWMSWEAYERSCEEGPLAHWMKVRTSSKYSQGMLVCPKIGTGYVVVMEKDMSCLHLDFLMGFVDFCCVFNCGSLLKVMVHSWFGARWFGFLGSPSVTSGVPLWIPNHRAPNQEFIGWRKIWKFFFLWKFHSLPSCFGEVTVLGTSLLLSKFRIPKSCPAPTRWMGFHFKNLPVAWQSHPGGSPQKVARSKGVFFRKSPDHSGVGIIRIWPEKWLVTLGWSHEKRKQGFPDCTIYQW